MSNSNWIFNKKEDLKWIFAPCLLSLFIIIFFIFFTKYLDFSKSIITILIFIIWAFFFDSTHLFGTYIRTYFDKEYFFANKKKLLSSLIVFIIGPFLLFIFIFFPDNYLKSFFFIFNRIAFFLGYCHLIKQNWGFICIYRKKNGEKSLKTKQLDKIIFFTSCFIPIFLNSSIYIRPFTDYESFYPSRELWNIQFLIFTALTIISIILHTVFFRKKMSLFKNLATIFVLISITIKFIQYYSIESFINSLTTLCFFILICSFIYYLFFIPRQNSKKSFSNHPKLVLAITVIFIHFFILISNIPLAIVIAALTIFHNVQYHKVINNYGKHRYTEKNKNKYGSASRLFTNITFLIIIFLLFFTFFYTPRFASIYFNINTVHYILISILFWGIPFHHYYLDSIIWKISKDKEVSKSFKI